MKRRVVIIGSGNVATHLAKGLQEGGCKVVQVLSRDISHAHRLADTLVGCEAIDSPAQLDRTAYLYLIAVSDASVAEIAGSMPQVEGIVAHTSGSVPLRALQAASLRTAVLYPLQTFTREARVELGKVPFFTEASDESTFSEIDEFARLMSPNVYHADSSQRKTLHIAGVLSCNFVNYLWDCTSEVLKRDGYDFKVVEPLICATLDKALTLGPHASQTGPAMRCDAAVMREHMSRLDPQTAELYEALTCAILKAHQLECDFP